MSRSATNALRRTRRVFGRVVDSFDPDILITGDATCGSQEGVYDSEERQVLREAERIADRTALSLRQAIVLVATDNDWPNRKIGRFIGRSNSTVERTRAQIRNQHRGISEQITELRNTKEATQTP